MWPLSVAIFLLYFAGCWAQSCNRTKANFESWNFFSVLHWDPVDVPGQTLLYSVQFNLYGKPYEPVTWCQNISTPVCDMTDVMTHVMSDVTSKYHAKVSASGQCLAEVMFKPFWQKQEPPEDSCNETSHSQSLSSLGFASLSLFLASS